LTNRPVLFTDNSV